MKVINATTIGNLISAHYEHDEEKFNSYVRFIIEAYEEEGEQRKANIIRKRADGSYKKEPTVVLDKFEHGVSLNDTALLTSTEICKDERLILGNAQVLTDKLKLEEIGVAKVIELGKEKFHPEYFSKWILCQIPVQKGDVVEFSLDNNSVLYKGKVMEYYDSLLDAPGFQSIVKYNKTSFSNINESAVVTRVLQKATD